MEHICNTNQRWDVHHCSSATRYDKPLDSTGLGAAKHGLQRHPCAVSLKAPRPATHDQSWWAWRKKSGCTAKHRCQHNSTYIYIYISNNIIYIIYIHSSIKDYKSTCVNICKNLLCSMQIQLWASFHRLWHGLPSTDRTSKFNHLFVLGKDQGSGSQKITGIPVIQHTSSEAML